MIDAFCISPLNCHSTTFYSRMTAPRRQIQNGFFEIVTTPLSGDRHHRVVRISSRMLLSATFTAGHSFASSVAGTLRRRSDDRVDTAMQLLELGFDTSLDTRITAPDSLVAAEHKSDDHPVERPDVSVGETVSESHDYMSRSSRSLIDAVEAFLAGFWKACDPALQRVFNNCRGTGNGHRNAWPAGRLSYCSPFTIENELQT